MCTFSQYLLDSKNMFCFKKYQYLLFERHLLKAVFIFSVLTLVLNYHSYTPDLNTQKKKKNYLLIASFFLLSILPFILKCINICNFKRYILFQRFYYFNFFLQFKILLSLACMEITKKQKISTYTLFCFPSTSW